MTLMARPGLHHAPVPGGVFVSGVAGELALRGSDVLALALAHGLELSAGDFVRWCRQVVDLLDQIHAVAGDDPVGRTAADAVRAVRRGVVAVGDT